MNLRFLGVGAAFSPPDLWQSNMLLTSAGGRRMLIDCGGDIRFSLADAGIDPHALCRDLDAVYISHLHSDHIGGLEWLAFTTYFQGQPRPRLFMEEKMMADMWEHALVAGLGTIEGRRMRLEDYFDCRTVRENGHFVWEDTTFELARMPHVTAGDRNHDSHGLIISPARGGRVFLTTDTKFAPELLTQYAAGAELVFHDCETQSLPSRVHAHYGELATLPVDLKAKIWLYHYQVCPKWRAEGDGFKGFIRKGWAFDIGNHVGGK